MAGRGYLSVPPFSLFHKSGVLEETIQIMAPFAPFPANVEEDALSGALSFCNGVRHVPRRIAGRVKLLSC